MQKGGILIWIIVGLLLLGGLGIGIYKTGFHCFLLYKINNPCFMHVDVLPKDQVPMVLDPKVYSSDRLNISFPYSKDLSVKEDTEDEFNKRGNGDFRKNFKSYIQYEPGKFIGAVVVLENEQDYDVSPLTLWVFDNSDNLTIEDWHDKYWYYPFVWGDFTSRGKIDYAPTEVATISGQLTKSKVLDYQPNKPKFVYLTNDKKMYLFRIIGEIGEKIMSDIRFL